MKAGPVKLATVLKGAVRQQILPAPPARPGAFKAGGPLVVAGMFRTMNGIGRAAWLCYENLLEDGLSPLAVDTSAILDQVQLPAPMPLSLLNPSASGTLILFANPPEVERCLMALGLRRWHKWRIIGAWAWETPIAPPEWRRQAGFVSDIWAPSAFVAEAFRAAYDRPVRNVPHSVGIQFREKHGAASPAHRAASARSTVQVLHMADARSHPLSGKTPGLLWKCSRWRFLAVARPG